MKMDLQIWVLGDHRRDPPDRLTLQLLAKARSLAGEGGMVTAILVGRLSETIANKYIASGAHRVLLADHPRLALYQADLWTTLISDLVQEHEPDIFLVASNQFGKEVAPRVAKRLGVGLCADCISLDWDPETERLIASSPAFGGNYLADIVWNTRRPYMATVSPGIASELLRDEDARGEIVRVKRDFDQFSSRISVVSSVRDPHQTSKLEEARTVVVGGRGLKHSEGFGCLRELASLLGGEIGATRPAVDAHWVSNEQLIGQTGRSVKPELLITCGTSGASQYTAGLRGARTIVAINRAPRAPIFKVADFGVVTDALSFLPAFILELKHHLFQGIADLYRTQVKGDTDRKSISFGQRIKKLRENQGMGVSALAEKTGQPPEFIEQVESDSLTPPVSFLLQLSQALGVDPSHFLTEQEKIQIDGKRQESFIKRTQNYSYRTLTPGAADKHLRSFMVTIEPREKHKIVEYKHPGEEFIFVYKGQLELTLGNRVHHLKQGETIHFDSETKHKLRNLSDEKCELIVTLYTP